MLLHKTNISTLSTRGDAAIVICPIFCCVEKIGLASCLRDGTLFDKRRADFIGVESNKVDYD